MAKRESVKLPPQEAPLLDKNIYFATVNKTGIDFIHTGCRLLDCVLGGGWALGRISNLVGDRSSGKTLLAMEACANMHIKYPDAPIYYAETEAAFDEDYAAALGIPIDAITFIENEDNTVETFYEVLADEIIPYHLKSGDPGIYILDSLDAVSDRTEIDRDIDEATYGGNKPKKLSEIFRRVTSDVEKSNLHLQIVSQVRDNIGVTFGSKKTRSGGKALDFYASQILWLAEKAKLTKTVNKIKRPIGVQVVANCKKNKVGLPFRTCEFPIYFGYGVDDLVANLEFLNDAGFLCNAQELLNLSDKPFTATKTTTKGAVSAFVREMKGKLTPAEMKDLREELNEIVVDTWQEIEKTFLPKHSKY